MTDCPRCEYPVRQPSDHASWCHNYCPPPATSSVWARRAAIEATRAAIRASRDKRNTPTEETR